MEDGGTARVSRPDLLEPVCERARGHRLEDDRAGRRLPLPFPVALSSHFADRVTDVGSVSASQANLPQPPLRPAGVSGRQRPAQRS